MGNHTGFFVSAKWYSSLLLTLLKNSLLDKMSDKTLLLNLSSDYLAVISTKLHKINFILADINQMHNTNDIAVICVTLMLRLLIT